MLKDKLINNLKLILSIALLICSVNTLEANIKKCDSIKGKKIKNHNPGCDCGGKPPNPPKFWFWFNAK